MRALRIAQDHCLLLFNAGGGHRRDPAARSRLKLVSDYKYLKPGAVALIGTILKDRRSKRATSATAAYQSRFMSTRLGRQPASNHFQLPFQPFPTKHFRRWKFGTHRSAINGASMRIEWRS